VAAGDTIAQLDSTSAQNTYEQAMLNHERAQINLDDLYAPVSDTDRAVAEANVASAMASYNAIANGTSDVESAQLQYDQALTTYNAQVTSRQQAPYSDEQELALKEAAIGAASFNLEIARLQMEDSQTVDSAALWSAGARIQIAQLNLEALMAGPSDTQIAAAEIAVQRAELQIQTAETALARTTLTAPINGTITAVYVEEGQTISTSTVIVEISDLSNLILVAPVHEIDINKIAEGSTANVQLDAIDGLVIPATVDRISWLSSESDGVVTYDTYLRIETDDPRVRIGMTAEAFISRNGQ